MSDYSHQFSHSDFVRLPFDIQCDVSVFSTEEQEKLRKYGSWLHALMQGHAAPTSQAQKAFVQCCHGKKSAETEFEILWVKYRLQVMFERVQRMEKTLADGRDYADIRKEYARLARMGHAGARAWMEKEGPWVNSGSGPMRGGLISHAYDRDSTNTLARRVHGSFGSKYGPGQGPADDPNPIE